MADLPDTHHKMSKKIAQLTKVIFHLNTRNDEASLYHQAQAEAYEKEIERIVKDANAIIGKQRQLLEQQKSSSDTASLLTNLQTQFEEAKTKGQIEVASFKSKLEEREAQTQKHAAQQVETYKRELAELKTAFHKQMSQLEGKQLTSAAALDELKRAHKAELDAYVKEQNAKYSKLLQEKLDSEDAYEEKLKQLAREWESKLQQAVQQTRLEEQDKAKQQLAQVSADYDARLELAARQLNDTTALKNNLETTVAQLQKEIAALNQLAGEWETKYSKLMAQYQQLETDQLTKGQQAQHLDSELARALQQINALSATIKEKDKHIETITAEHTAQVTSLKNEIEALQANLGEKEKMLYTELENKNQRIESLQHQIALLEQNLEEAKQLQAATAEELASVQAELERERLARASEGDVLLSENQKREALIRSLQEEIQSLTQTIKDLKLQQEEGLKDLKQEIEALKHRHAAELTDKANTHSEALDKLKQELERQRQQALDKLGKDHEYFKTCLKEEFNKQFNEMKAKYEAEIKQLKELMNNKEGESSQFVNDLQRQISELHSTNNALNLQVTDLTEKLTELQSKYSAITLENKKLETTIQTLNNELNALKQSGSEATTRLLTQIDALKQELLKLQEEARKKLEEALAGSSNSHSQELQELKLSHAKELEDLKKKHQETLAKAANELAQVKTDHEAKISKLLSEKEQLNQEWEAKFKQIQAEMTQKIRDIESRGNSGLEQLDAKHKAELEALKTAHRQELELAKQEAQADKERALKQAETHKQKELEVQARAHEEKLQKFSQDFDKHLAQKIEEYEKAIQELKTKMEQALTAKDKEISRYQHDKTELETSVKSLQEQISELNKKIEAAHTLDLRREKEIKDLEAKILSMTENFQSEFNALEEEYKRKETELKNYFKAERENLLKDHLEGMAQLQQDFQSTTEMMEERYTQLKERFEELQEELRVKEEALKKAYEDMKFFKLELRNREDNYNKMFGANPTIGVHNPINSKKPPPKEPKSTQRTNTSLVRKSSKFKDPPA